MSPDTRFRFDGARTLEDLQAKVQQGLEEYKTKQEKIIAFKGPARELLRLIDQASLCLEYGLTSLVDLHPDAAFREGAKDLQQQKDKTTNAFWASPELYQKVKDLNDGDLNAYEVDLKHRWLKAMVGNGAALDSEHRERFLGINVKMNSLRMSFDKTLADDDRSIKVSVEDLAGVPEEFIAKRKVQDGMVTLTARYPDVLPVRLWAHSADAREKVYRLSKDAGYPNNGPILLEYLKLAHERAQLLGFKNAVDANFGTSHLVADEAGVRKLLDLVLERTREPAAQLLEEQRAVVGDDAFEGKQFLPWNRGYAEDQVMSKRFDGFDSKQLAPYFPAKEIPGRLLRLCETLFNVELVPQTHVGVWHPSVQVYDVWDPDCEEEERCCSLIGQLYLDMGPREGKNRHASAGFLQRGLAGRHLPQVRLLANVPDGEGDHMMLDDVRTLFHELGHCFHAIIGSYKQPYFEYGAFDVERDVVEAPSTLLENWLQDPAVLKRIAIDAEGNVMPDKLIKDVATTDAYARVGDTRIQIALAMQAVSTCRRLGGDRTIG